MSIEVISIGSSSSGNSYIVSSERGRLLIDVGLTMKRILEGLAAADIDPQEVDAVLITHEHTDHVKSVRAISRKCGNALFLSSRGTISRTGSFSFVPDERIRTVASGEIINIGDIEITAFSLSHDAAEPLGYSIAFGGGSGDVKKNRERLTVVTDTGIVTDEMYNVMKGSDILILEANHDEELLMFGEYPYSLKRRIKGEYGHLSNRYAGEVLAALLEDRRAEQSSEEEAAPLRVMLAHLSEHNNAPFYARHTVEDILNERGFSGGSDYSLTVAFAGESVAIRSA